MSAEIRHISFSANRSRKSILDECNQIARRYSEHNKSLVRGIRFYDSVKDSYEKAYEFLRYADTGYYDNLAVMFIDENKNKSWLVKIEYRS